MSPTADNLEEKSVIFSSFTEGGSELRKSENFCSPNPSKPQFNTETDSARRSARGLQLNMRVLTISNSVRNFKHLLSSSVRSIVCSSRRRLLFLPSLVFSPPSLLYEFGEPSFRLLVIFWYVIPITSFQFISFSKRSSLSLAQNIGAWSASMCRCF
jgi:hypothetical protein